MAEEIWKWIPGYEGDYEVSDRGRVRSWSHNRGRRTEPKILKVLGEPYLHVVLYKNKRPKTLRVHRVLMLAFVGPRPAGYDVCHNNDVKTDNRLENLRYDTKSNNLKDKFINGTDCNKGENHAQAKLTDEIVREIRRLSAEKVLQKDIAQRFNISPKTVSGVVTRVAWSHVLD